jgi:DNA-binding response OmpR family regulator
MDFNSSDTGPRVLIVDDERVIREILADFLSLEGFWVAPRRTARRRSTSSTPSPTTW